jgi:hypothetical protein
VTALYLPVLKLLFRQRELLIQFIILTTALVNLAAIGNILMIITGVTMEWRTTLSTGIRHHEADL